MPTLNQRATKTVKLKTIEGGEVVIYTSFTALDAENMQKNVGKSAIITPMVLLIKSWNITNAEGQALSLDETNIGLLDIKDVEHIVEESGISQDSFLEGRKT